MATATATTTPATTTPPEATPATSTPASVVSEPVSDLEVEAKRPPINPKAKLKATEEREALPESPTSTPESTVMPLTPVMSPLGPAIADATVLKDLGEKLRVTLVPSSLAVMHNTCYLMHDGKEIMKYQTDMPGLKTIGVLTLQVLSKLLLEWQQSRTSDYEAEAGRLINGFNEAAQDGASRRMVTSSVVTLVRAATGPSASLMTVAGALMLNYLQGRFFGYDNRSSSLTIKADWSTKRKAYKIMLTGPNANFVRMHWLLRPNSETKTWELTVVDYRDIEPDPVAAAAEDAPRDLLDDMKSPTSEQAISEEKVEEKREEQKEALFKRYEPQLRVEGLASGGLDEGNEKQQTRLMELASNGAERPTILTPTTNRVEDVAVALDIVEPVGEPPRVGPGSEKGKDERPQDDGDRKVPDPTDVQLAIPMVPRAGDRVLDTTQNSMITTNKAKLVSVAIGGINIQTLMQGSDEHYFIDFEGDMPTVPRDVLCFAMYVARSHQQMPVALLITLALAFASVTFLYALVGMILNHFKGKSSDWNVLIQSAPLVSPTVGIMTGLGSLLERKGDQGDGEGEQ